MDWNYKEYPRILVKLFTWFGLLLLVPRTASAKTTGIRNIRQANMIVLKTLEIIKYFSPKVWIIENPQTGLLKKQPFMDNIDFYDVDYCKYGFRYRKRTRIWTNLKGWEPKPLCKKDCGNVVDGKHLETAQRLPCGKKADWGENYIVKKTNGLVPNAPTTYRRNFPTSRFKPLISRGEDTVYWQCRREWRFCCPSCRTLSLWFCIFSCDHLLVVSFLSV